MPYNFGNLGQTFGEKLAGVIRPSNTAEAKAKRAQDIKDAREAEKQAYEREQDKIKNFADYGGYDPAQVMAGSQQDALLSDDELAGFQKSMTAQPGFNPAAERAFRGFQEKLGSRGLNFEQRKELERLHAEETRRTKAQPSGGTVDKYGGMGGAADQAPLEDKPKDYLPWSIRHPFATMGTQSQEEADVLRKQWDQKPAGKDTVSEEVRMVNGKPAIFDSKTKKFLRYK